MNPWTVASATLLVLRLGGEALREEPNLRFQQKPAWASRACCSAATGLDRRLDDGRAQAPVAVMHRPLGKPC